MRLAPSTGDIVSLDMEKVLPKFNSRKVLEKLSSHVAHGGRDHGHLGPSSQIAAAGANPVLIKQPMVICRGNVL